MRLTEKTKKELKKILFAEFGDKDLEFSEEEVENLGILFLELAAISLKRKFFNDS